MKAIVITKPGGPEVLEIREKPKPSPSPGEILVKVRAFALNRADLLQCRGLYPAPDGWPADIPGLEYAGEVEAIAPDVTEYKVGDRVMGIVGGGAYAEYLATPASHAMAIPNDLEYVEAAAIPEAFITAYDALERLGVVSGEWVLVHAVGSGVGTAALSLARGRGAKVIGTSRTQSKLERAIQMGLDVAIDTVNEDLVRGVKKATVDGVDAAVDLIGGSMFPRTMEAMATFGRIVVVGLTGGAKTEINLGALLQKRLKIEGTVLRSRSNDEKTRLIRSFKKAVLNPGASGGFVPTVDSVFDFSEIQKAHIHLLSNQNFGNVVVRVG